MGFEVIHEQSGVLVRLSGTVTGDDCKIVNEAIYGRTGSPARYQIWDFSQAQRLDITLEQLHQMLIQDKAAEASHPDMVSAVVATPELLNNKQATYQRFSQWLRVSLPTRVFGSLAEAREWIEDTGSDRTTGP